MRRLLCMLLGIFLFAGLVNGSMLHAAELAGGGGELSCGTGWEHADGDADHVPADSDKNYPHHHGVCHGHDLAAPLKAPRAMTASARASHHWTVGDIAVAGTAPGIALRPPID